MRHLVFIWDFFKTHFPSCMHLFAKLEPLATGFQEPGMILTRLLNKVRISKQKVAGEENYDG